ncbi:putative ethylene-responsive transcription factor RAP2-9 [Iris pallida]|uniref:Ethylene-responsive transcription factor RAP2-9 n=1 Tax=Iris pallida TaxID=29817 RepID=A0AAX6H631_IRIPA|nr:putative ethylene-responsive transcription factor RAP2-9 [Iris pallida]
MAIEGGECWPTTATATTTRTSTSSSSSGSGSEEMKMKRSSMSSSSPAASGKGRVYRGVRMRKWGKWVAEIREPKKRTRIWLGSYSTPVAAARAYDTAVFLLRGRSARLNFPEEISAAEETQLAAADAECLSAASIRKKATEVGARIDALQMGLQAPSNNQKQQQQQQQRPDLNQHPSPDSSDEE